MVRSLTFVLLAAALVGCASTTIRPHPTEHDTGFRFYRPKPFLFVTPAGVSDTVDGPDQVEISLQMLPDFGEQYSVNVKPGVGWNQTIVDFKDGWQVNSITSESDTKTAENIKAAKSLAQSIAALTVAGGGKTNTDPTLGATRKIKTCLPARNVPLGFYEAVINRDPCGTKQMYGWRYVGFSPYGSCPTAPAGVQGQDCATAPLYGLVPENGVTVFKQLDLIAQDPLRATTYPQSNIPKSAAELEEQLRTISKTLVNDGNGFLTDTVANKIETIDFKFPSNDATAVRIVITLTKPDAQPKNVVTALRVEWEKSIRTQPGLKGVSVKEVEIAPPVKP